LQLGTGGNRGRVDGLDCHLDRQPIPLLVIVLFAAGIPRSS
jgi:hypothetical protein